MCPSVTLQTQLLDCLTTLYGDGAGACLARVLALAGQHREAMRAGRERLWDARDVVLIAYGDQLQHGAQTPLATLRQFLQQQGLTELIRILHILPFFPSSSDDGFAVSDYEHVDPAIGSWCDVRELAGRVDLMFDLVLNHCSTQHRWFQQYLAGQAPYTGYFIESDAAADLSQVTRPRSTPLLTPFRTAAGVRHVWTTFSADQVDLNWANPDVLLEMLHVLFSYVAHGARIIRLDAIAYLWKQIDTPCIHLRQTHAVVKLMRLLLDACAPGTLLLTETNVPHDENVSYFGAGDEAHIVYQFSLPPLVLDAFLNRDATPLMSWLAQLEPARPGTTYLNFTASHDGVGLRPLESLLPAERVERLVAEIIARGGLTSTRRRTDGTDSVYELNVSYFSALGDPADHDTVTHVRRFLAAQAVMLALRGIPAVYFHSLFGTPNDREGVQRTGRARTINRRKFQRDELLSLLASPTSPPAQVLAGYRQMLAVRGQQPAFHPDAAQDVLELNHPALITVVRTCPTTGQQILAVTNVASTPVSVSLPADFGPDCAATLWWMGATWGAGGTLTLLPAGGAWLSTYRAR